MARTVIGELIPFTLRTLYVVPVVYTFREVFGAGPVLPLSGMQRGFCLTDSARGLTRVNVSTGCVYRGARAARLTP